MARAYDRLELARRHLVDHGACLPSALNDRLARSWQRSLHAGVEPFAMRDLVGPMDGAPLAHALEQNAQMLSFARPVMDFMYAQIRGGDCMVVLADAGSMLLHTLGDNGFLSKARQVELRAGASWHESVRGTNAIGTAIEDGTALQVRAGEHYLQRNGFLHCSAAPIFTAQGAIAGAIDISGDERASHQHALGLASSAARLIENNWLKARYRDSVRVHMHSAAEGLDTPAEGIVVLTEEGTLIGANQEAIRALRLAPHDFFALQLENRLQQRLAQPADGTAAPADGYPADALQLAALARGQYQKLAPLAVQYGDLNARIDARAADFALRDKDPAFVGLQRIAAGLQAGEPADQLLPLAISLQQDVQQLSQRLGDISLQPQSIAAAAAKALERASTLIPGEATTPEQGRAVLQFVNGSWAAANKAQQVLGPVLAHANPALNQQLQDSLGKLRQRLDELGLPADDSQAADIAGVALNPVQCQNLAQALYQASQSMAKVNAALGLQP